MTNSSNPKEILEMVHADSKSCEVCTWIEFSGDTRLQVNGDVYKAWDPPRKVIFVATHTLRPS